MYIFFAVNLLKTVCFAILSFWPELWWIINYESPWKPWRSLIAAYFRFNFLCLSPLWVFQFSFVRRAPQILAYDWAQGQAKKKKKNRKWKGRNKGRTTGVQGKGFKWNGNRYFEWHTKSVAITEQKLSIDCHLTRALTSYAKIDKGRRIVGPQRDPFMSSVNWAAQNPFRIFHTSVGHKKKKKI